MNFDLFKAAQELKVAMKEHNITVDMTTNNVCRKKSGSMSCTIVRPTARRVECRRIIYKYIKEAKAEKVEAQFKKQERMF